MGKALPCGAICAALGHPALHPALKWACNKVCPLGCKWLCDAMKPERKPYLHCGWRGTNEECEECCEQVCSESVMCLRGCRYNVCYFVFAYPEALGGVS